MEATAIEISDLIGTPFKIHGRDLDGIDCWGVVMLIESRKGNIIPDFAYDGTEPTFCDHMINGNIDLVTEIVGPEPLCTVTFSIRQPWVHHMGIVLPKTGYFIHVMRKRHVVVERLDSDSWKRKIRGFYTWNH